MHFNTQFTTTVTDILIKAACVYFNTQYLQLLKYGSYCVWNYKFCEV